MKSSVTMQAYTQMPPVGLQLHAPQQTSCSRVPGPMVQVQYYIAQQRMSNQQNTQQSHGLRNNQTSSQPVSSSSSLQSRQMPQAWLSDLQNQMLHRNSASMRATLPNGQFAPLAAAQHGTPMQNLSHHPQTLNRNTVPQQNYNMPPLCNVSSPTTVSWFSSVNSSAGSATEQNNLAHQSVLPQYQSLSGHRDRMQISTQPEAQPQQTDLSVQINHTQQKILNNQGQISGGKGNGTLYSSVRHFPATSQRFITPSQPSNYSHQTGQNHSSCNRNPVQHSSQIQYQPSPYRTQNNSASCSHLNHSGNNHQGLMSKLPQPPPYTSQHFITQSDNPKKKKNIQRIIQSSALSLPQENVPPQAPLQQRNNIPVSGHHSKTYQGNTHPQVLQLNNSINGLPRSSQVTSEVPPPNYTESILEYSQVTLMDLLVKENTHVLAQSYDTSPLSCPNASFTTQMQTPSHIITKANYSQTPETAPYWSAPATVPSKELHRVSEYQTPVQRTAILKDNEHVVGNQLKAPDVQNFKGVQSRRLQTDSNTERPDGHQRNNRHGEVQYSEDVAESLELVVALQEVFRQSHKAVAVVPPISQQLPSAEKNDPVTTSSNDSLPFKVSAVWTLVKECKDVDQESNAVTLPKETSEVLPHTEKQESNKLEDGSTVDSLIPDTQSTEIPQSKIDSTISQDLVCSTALTSKSPEDHNKVKTGKSNDTIFDLSMVQVHNFTLENFIYCMKILESSAKRRVQKPVADVVKCLLDLYWDGNTENIVKHIAELHADLSGLSSKVSKQEIQTANFQYLEAKDLKMLAHGYHILENDTKFPAEEFRSSWLNIDGQPADIENVLAEPMLDFNLTDYPLHRGFETLNIYSESGPSTKVIPVATNCQIDKELVNSQVCASNSTDKVSNTQEASKKQEDENIEKHQQQDVNLCPEESVDSNEITDTVAESKSQTECEQVCRYESKEEILEQSDLSNDLNSSNDFQLISLSLLSADDMKAIFKEYSGCDLQKDNFQLCQDETKVSDKESNDFFNSTNRIKFTCPHITDTDTDRDGEDFCSKCWEDTPLLHLDLEEALLSPMGDSPNMITPPKQGHHKADSNCTVLSESSSIANSQTPNVDVFEVTVSDPDPNPNDAVENCTSLSGNSPVKEPHAPICTQSSTMPIEEQVCETNISVGPELPKVLTYTQNIENLVIPEQTKTPRDEVSPIKSSPCKNSKLTKTAEIPAKDDFFTTDIVTKKAASPKHPSDFGTPAEDGQNCKDERKEQEERKAPLKLKVQTIAQCSQSVKPNPNVNICSESSSDTSNPSIYRVNMSTGESLGDSLPGCSSLSGKSPDKETHERVCSGSVKVTLPIEKQVCEADSLSGTELPKAHNQKTKKRKAVIQAQTTTSRENSPPTYPPCKRIRVTKTISKPVGDDLFMPDIVVKKASSPTPHPSDLSVTLIKDGQHCKDEWKERGKDRKSPIRLKIHLGQHSVQTTTEAHGKTPSMKSQVPNDTPQPKRHAVATNSASNTTKVLGQTRGPGQNKRMKKLRFALYGFNNSNVQHQCHNRAKSYVAPAYITVSNRPETGNSYTDAPSAKQKVYSQWSSTFVETKKNSSSHKKHQKSVKVELKSRTQALKRLVQDRIARKEKQMV